MSPKKGYKYLAAGIILLSWIGLRAETVQEADPDYINIQRDSKPAASGPQSEDVTPIAKISETVEINDALTEEKEYVETIVEVSEKAETPVVYKESKGSAEIEEFKRDIESVEFVPKGQWIFGLSVSYTQSSQDKYQFLILEGISGDTYSFKISPMVMFAVKADLALGGRFSYARSLTKVANAEIVLDSETNYSFDHLYRLSHNYYGAALMRNYFSIGRSKRFGFFNEISLQLGGGQTKLTTGLGEDLTGSYERNFSLNVGLTPGLCIFLSNYSALEVNVGLLGFNYNETKSIKDQIYVSKRNYQSANFRINLFSITFGATFYI